MYIVINGKKVKQFRKERGLTLMELSIQVGCSAKTVERIEASAEYRTLYAADIAAALDVSIEEILFDRAQIAEYNNEQKLQHVLEKLNQFSFTMRDCLYNTKQQIAIMDALTEEISLLSEDISVEKVK